MHGDYDIVYSNGASVSDDGVQIIVQWFEGDITKESC